MQGISSKAVSFGGAENKRGYNGNELQNKEFSDGSGLEFYDFNARMYDQQLGRFMQIDPLSEEGEQESWGPFGFGYDNPVRYNDPDGKCPCLIPVLVEVAKAAVAAYIAYKTAEASKPLIENVVKSTEDNAQGKGNKPNNNQNNSNDKKPGTYSHPQSQKPLPRQDGGEPAPDPEATGPHTQLGSAEGRKGTYNQAREFDANGKPVKDIDFTDHGRPETHPHNPHQHVYKPNPTGGTPQRSKSADPLTFTKIILKFATGLW